MNRTPDTLDTAPQTAREAGHDLGRYVLAHEPASMDPQRIRDLVARLIEAPCTTAADALACAALARDLYQQTAVAILEMDQQATLDLLAYAATLSGRAVEALEGVTGLAAEGFTGATEAGH